MAGEDGEDFYVDIGDSESGKNAAREDMSSDSKDMLDIGSAMEALTRVDLDLAYSSEKLVNLDTLMMHVWAWEKEFEALATDDISVDCIEKALAYDLLSGILESEVRALENFMSTLQLQMADARLKISSCGHLRELFTAVEVKLYDSEESLKQSQEHALEMKMQLTKLQMTSLAFNPTDWKYNSNTGLPDDSQGSIARPQMQTAEQRHVLRMLEKSLARELDFEKKLTALKQNEEDLKLKLQLTEQVSFFMEEAAEVVWGRFIEAENTAEVLMGISKEMVGRLQVVQFNRNGSIQREEEMKVKLQDCIEQLRAKEVLIQKLSISEPHLMTNDTEVIMLREKVNSLEEQLRESVSQLQKANVSNKAYQEQLKDMDYTIESLKENIYDAENRADDAETKTTQLTETNLELTEELGLLKSSNDSNTKKASLLEKQSRDLELQLQHAKASSEASQEQQNMLYSAIWDMETLIDELKQKVSQFENKAENAEEQCILSTETNVDLNRELEFLRGKIERLETSLEESRVEKIASAKDVNIKTSLIMDMVMQLATERKRIQEQMYSLSSQNRSLMAKLQNTTDGSAGLQNGVVDNNNLSGHNESNAHIMTQPSPDSIKTEEILEDPPACTTAVEPSTSTECANDSDSSYDEEEAVQTGKPRHKYFFMTILVLLVSVLAAYLFDNKAAFFSALKLPTDPIQGFL
ncbi:WPP domain-interacting tail-anchored protein 2 [Daucus carota subsp. sativus]|uniref:WIT1/2 N-terminal helical bundle domain-containing protein n=1 Tax=Daucus carota subsp. sativus TaxID=79200 RepID=A0A175YQY4_DAUCS|nr:PREDICTED: WPP domain-interacting tail-anchored protein 2-like [Daucus carota subsp. sativus]XP_017222940.1 PREDICTED: WPP domain-interacting tail-anchored protein 2-like [Daucus carota subsp. sativus]XP_017222941.1 PREDICTED: WPP domain-interacting tail-anchored protein 2-like [Daucus carota subsp. sativus]XP_017222942.1 PREDICTED: WPP domain-interacting tail-anchored protein 2-like [Daucus carota subsp. sativus]XP_017222943.1 PREDICTED: WPP domain-interacting tail-anchored protein 2-like [